MFNKLKRQRKKYENYLKKHKKNIIKAFYEMICCPEMIWLLADPELLEEVWRRVLVHDNSKFEKEEFEPYRKNYFPINEKEKLENKQDYLKARQHHVKYNDHHWQNRIHWGNKHFNLRAKAACLENILDWMAVGYEYNNRPYEYYEKYKTRIHLSNIQKDFMEKCIYNGIDKRIIEERKQQKREV